MRCRAGRSVGGMGPWRCDGAGDLDCTGRQGEACVNDEQQKAPCGAVCPLQELADIGAGEADLLM